MILDATVSRLPNRLSLKFRGESLFGHALPPMLKS